jgi:hypothetical protein
MLILEATLVKYLDIWRISKFFQFGMTSALLDYWTKLFFRKHLGLLGGGVISHELVYLLVIREDF